MAAGFAIKITAIDSATKHIDAVNKRLAAIRAPVEQLNKSLSTFGRLSGVSNVAQGFERMGRGALGAFQSVARIVAPLSAITGAASVAGMYRMVEAWGQWGSQLGFAAQRIGITAASLQTFQNAGLLAGVQTATMTSGIQALGQSMYEAIGGRAPETVALFNQLGIAFSDGTRHARSVEQVLPQLADKIASIKDPYTQARVAAQLFGGAAEQMLPFLRLGSKGIADLEDRARRYGATSPAAVAAANKMRESQANLTLAVTGLGNSISEKLAPIIAPLLNQMADWIGANRAWLATDIGYAVKQFADWVKTIDLKAIVADVKSFAANANAVVQALGGWKRVAEGIVAIKLAGWAASAIAPFATVLRLMALIPGSGVTGAALAEVGLGTVALTGAGIGNRDANPQARFRVPRPGGAFGPGGTRDTDNRQSGISNWLDRQLQSLGIEGTSPAPGSKQAAMDYFSKTWGRDHAAGIVASLFDESGLRPDRVGDGGQAYGAGQWHADRQAEFKAWSGHDIHGSSLAEQYGFVNYELTQGNERAAGNRLKAANGSYDSGAVVSRFYERPAAADEAARNRGALAVKLADGAVGASGANGRVDVTVKVAGGQVEKTTARASGNVNPPKVATSGVGTQGALA